MFLTDIIHSRMKYEDRLKSIDDYISYTPINKALVNKLNEDILHMKYNARHGYLKRVIEKRGIDAYSTIEKLQDYRNKHFKVNGGVDSRLVELTDIVDGKYNHRWKARLENLDDKLENIYKNKGSLNDLDEMKYVLYFMEHNKYLNSHKDKDTIKIKKSVKKKIKKYIRRNKKVPSILKYNPFGAMVFGTPFYVPLLHKLGEGLQSLGERIKARTENTY